jgi:hypothetical protein
LLEHLRELGQRLSPHVFGKGAHSAPSLCARARRILDRGDAASEADIAAQIGAMAGVMASFYVTDLDAELARLNASMNPVPAAPASAAPIQPSPAALPSTETQDLIDL